MDTVPSSREEVTLRRQRELNRAARWKVFGAIVLASGIVWGTVALTAVLRDRGSDEPLAPTAEPVPEEGAAVLVAVTADDGSAASIALIAAADQSGARVVLLPPSLLTTLPGFGENTLANTVRFDGLQLLDVTVANLLGTRIDAAIELDADGVQDVVSADLVVDLADPLFESDDDAQVVVIGAGEAPRSPQQLARLLVDAGGDDELTWLQRQGAVWEALLRAAAEDPAMLERMLVDATRDAETARSVLDAAAESAVLTVVPATQIEPTGGEERYQLSGEVAAEFVDQTLPYLQLADEPRTRIEVLNGNGEIGTIRPVAARLIRDGYRVILTDNADRLDYAQTRIIAHGREHQEAALAVRETMGLGEVSVEVRQPSGVVDLTIIVGQDLAADGG